MNGPVAAVILFGIAALGGVFLAILRFLKKDLPMPVALVHGGVAASGLVTLTTTVVNQPGGPAGLAPIALGVLVVAALGGFVLFSFHVRKKLIPIPLLLVHALVAVAGYACLLASVFGSRVSG